MKEVIADVTALNGVHGAFVCGENGVVMARALPQAFDDSMLQSVGQVTGRALAGLETTGEVHDLDLVYSDVRMLVKNFGSGQLFVLCQPEVNVSFLNLTANVVAQKLRKSTQADGVAAVGASATKKNRIRGLVDEELGEQAGKAHDILNNAGDDRASLLKASGEIERMTRLFISKKKATDLSILIQAIIVE
jgi:predicted regulator of Ras-like GTPase activity (Roadblock/LC7/MglB family)